MKPMRDCTGCEIRRASIAARIAAMISATPAVVSAIKRVRHTRVRKSACGRDRAHDPRLSVADRKQRRRSHVAAAVVSELEKVELLCLRLVHELSGKMLTKRIDQWIARVRQR